MCDYCVSLRLVAMESRGTVEVRVHELAGCAADGAEQFFLHCFCPRHPSISMRTMGSGVREEGLRKDDPWAHRRDAERHGYPSAS